MLDKLTVAKGGFWGFGVNLVLLALCMIKKDIIGTIIHHKKRA